MGVPSEFFTGFPSRSQGGADILFDSAEDLFWIPYSKAPHIEQMPSKIYEKVR